MSDAARMSYDPVEHESWWSGVKRRARDNGDGYVLVPLADWQGVVGSWDKAEPMFIELAVAARQYKEHHPSFCAECGPRLRDALEAVNG